jgi:hypothetical protein
VFPQLAVGPEGKKSSSGSNKDAHILQRNSTHFQQELDFTSPFVAVVL